MSAQVSIGTVTTVYGTSVEQQFAKLLNEKIEAQRAVLEAGQLESIEKYKEHAGKLNAYKDALALWQQAQRDVQHAEGQLRQAEKLRRSV